MSQKRSLSVFPYNFFFLANYCHFHSFPLTQSMPISFSPCPTTSISLCLLPNFFFTSLDTCLYVCVYVCVVVLLCGCNVDTCFVTPAFTRWVLACGTQVMVTSYNLTIWLWYHVCAVVMSLHIWAVVMIIHCTKAMIVI